MMTAIEETEGAVDTLALDTLALDTLDSEALMEPLVFEESDTGEVSQKDVQALRSCVASENPVLDRMARERLAMLRPREPVTIDSMERAVEYLRPTMGGLEEPQFRVLLLNGLDEALGQRVVYRGDINHRSMDPAVILQSALRHDASAMVLVQSAGGAVDDELVSLTRRVVQAARTLDIPVYDHLVFGPDGVTSMLQAGCFPAGV